MATHEISEKTLVAVWQSIRTSIGIWDTSTVTLIVAGSGFICASYGILISNAHNLGDFLTAILSCILLLAAFGIHYGILRFRFASENGVRIAKELEDRIFGNENSLKITHQNDIEKNRFFKFFHDMYPKIWGTGLLFFSLLITLWRFLILLNP